MEENPGAFLVNLWEPLVLQDHVTFGLGPDDIQGDHVKTIDPGSREVNCADGNFDKDVSTALFDQILIPAWMLCNYVPDSCTICDHPDTLRGETSENRAVDHLPVYADFVFGFEAKITTLEDGEFLISWSATPGGSYDVMAISELAGIWQRINVDPILAETIEGTFRDVATSPWKFYQVRRLTVQ